MSARLKIIVVAVWLGGLGSLSSAERIDDFFTDAGRVPAATTPDSRPASSAIAPLLNALGASRSAEADADSRFASGDYRGARTAYIRWFRQDLSSAERFAVNDVSGEKKAGVASSLFLIHADAALILSCRACRYDPSAGDDAIESLRAALPSASRFPGFANRINGLISRIAARSGAPVPAMQPATAATDDAAHIRRFLTFSTNGASLTDDGAMFLKTEIGSLTNPTEEARLFYHSALITNDRRIPEADDPDPKRLARALLLIAETIEPSYSPAGFACATIDCPLPSGAAAHPLAVRQSVSRFIATNPNHIPALYYLAWDAIEYRRNLSAAETYIDRMNAVNPDFAPAAVLAAQVRIRRGDLPGARALLNAAGDLPAVLSLFASMPGEAIAARAAAIRALDRDRANPNAHLLAARRETETSAYSGAGETRQLLNAALERFNNDAQLTSALDRLDRRLGSAELTADSELMTDAAREPLEQIIQSVANNAAVDSTSDWTYLFKRERIIFDGSGGTEIESRRVVRVDTDAGAIARRREIISYNPASESVKISAAIVRRSSGEHREARYLTSPDAPGETGIRRRALIVFDALRPGDIIDIDWTIRRRRLDLPQDYSDALAFFDDDAPVIRSEITVSFPPSMTLSATAVSPDGQTVIRRASGAGRLDYRADNPPSYFADGGDRAAAPADAARPRVELSTHPAWPALSRMYYRLVRDALTCEPETLAAFGIRPLQPSEKEAELHRIMQRVAHSVRYQDRLLGESAYRPLDADAVYALRFGDCKDKTVLAVALLNAAGIKADPLLVRFVPSDSERGDEDFRLARITHFNHVIVFVPKQAGLPGDRFIDPTASQYRAGALPLGNAGALGCVVSDSAGRLIRVPNVRSQNADKSVLKNTEPGILSPAGK